MKRIPLPLLALLLGFGLVLPSVAHAVLMQVNFSIVWGQYGSFSFDSSLIPSGGGTVGSLSGATDYATSMTYHDALLRTWDSSTSGVSYLVFDGAGNLTGFQMGADVNGIGGSPVWPGGPNDFQVLATLDPVGGAGSSSWWETNVNSLQSDGSSAVTWTVTAVPAAAEPGTLALLVPGLLPLGLMLRRRNKS